MSDSGRNATRVRLPLLDRLLDSGPGGDDRDIGPQMSAEVLRQAVRRDLEALLNARRRRLPIPSAYAELPGSPIGYGVPDPTAGSFTDEARREAMAAEVEATIRRFEPRLTSVRVSCAPLPKDQRELIDRTLKLRIDAVLRSDPLPEQISFETMVRPLTLDVAVREA